MQEMMNEQKMFYVDTHKTVTSLVETGLETKQAEAIVDTFCEIRRNDVEQLATKEDLKKLEATTKEDIKRLEMATKEDIKRLEAATKEDIKRLETTTKENLKELDGKVEKLETKLTHEMRELKSDLMAHMHKMQADIHRMDAGMKTWFVSFMLAMLTMLVAIFMKMKF
jgi:citrate synthase